MPLQCGYFPLLLKLDRKKRKLLLEQLVAQEDRLVNSWWGVRVVVLYTRLTPYQKVLVPVLEDSLMLLASEGCVFHDTSMPLASDYVCEMLNDRLVTVLSASSSMTILLNVVSTFTAHQRSKKLELALHCWHQARRGCIGLVVQTIRRRGLLREIYRKQYSPFNHCYQYWPALLCLSKWGTRDYNTSSIGQSHRSSCLVDNHNGWFPLRVCWRWLKIGNGMGRGI